MLNPFRNFIFVFCLLVSLCQTSDKALAQNLSGTFADLGRNPDAPVEMQMDKFEIDENKQRALLSGNVTIRQANASMNADRVRVYFKGSLEKGGIENITKMEAEGNVIVISNDQRASSNRAEYDLLKQYLTMTGNVTLKRGKNTLKGEKLMVNLATGQSTLNAPKNNQGENGRVTIILKPNSSEE